MTTILVIIGIIIVYQIIKYFYKKSSDRSRQYTPPSSSSRSSTTPSKTSPYVYRPTSSRKSRDIIKFNSANNASVDLKNLEGLHDAFTGESLTVSLGLFQCNNCKVYYHRESYNVLIQENASRCVSCQSTKIVSLTGEQVRTSTGRDYQLQVVTLNNYHNFNGHVITFEGYVPRINTASDGKTLAVMFEDTSWTRGLKLVAFRGKINQAGGYTFLRSLQGRTVRVRGLLTRHNKYGWQIIITSRSMILEVK